MAIRMIYSASRFWRFYLLLVIASIMMTYMIYLSRNDPYLRNSFPYFRIDSKLKSFFFNANSQKIKTLMDKNSLDYEFMHSNAKFCMDKSTDGIVEDYMLFNDAQDTHRLKRPNDEFDLILIMISKAVNFRHRSAVRQTWSK
jgi:hypothetical protein